MSVPDSTNPVEIQSQPLEFSPPNYACCELRRLHRFRQREVCIKTRSTPPEPQLLSIYETTSTKLHKFHFVMDFYYMPLSAPCRAVMMAAKTIGVEMNMKLCNLMAGDHMKPEYLKLNPQHTIPTLVDNGFSVWESRPIMIYLVEKYARTDSLYPKCPQKQAVVNQRLYFDMGTMFKSFYDYYGPQMFAKKPADPEMYKKIETAFEFLNTFLEGQTYVAGDSLTIADISLVASVSTLEVAGFDFKKYSNVNRWYEHCKQVVPGWKENWEGCLALKEAFMKDLK